MRQQASCAQREVLARKMIALGTKTRPFVPPLLLLADVILITFAIGMWFAGDRNWALRVTAALVAGNAIFAMVSVVFFALHLEAAPNAPAKAMNAISMGISVLFFLLTMGFGAIANRAWFRYYSIGTPLIFRVLAIIRLSGVPPVPAARSLVGVQARTMIYGWLVWQALVLLQA